MKIAIDYRNAQWSEIQGSLQGRRLEVLSAWRLHGPGTTRELAQRSGIDLLGLRPRTTELLQLGLLVVVDEDQPGHEGRYRALSDDEAFALFNQRASEARGDRQLSLKM